MPRSGQVLWELRLNATLDRPIPQGLAAAELAGRFGLSARREALYDDFRLAIAPGEVLALVGPSGAGKTLLLRQAQLVCPGAISLDLAPLQRSNRLAINYLAGRDLPARLAVLSRCGLAEPAVLLRRARHLSAGQQYRLALAAAVERAQRLGGPALVLADEWASCLDRPTAWMLGRQIRKLADRSGLSFLLATPHDWVLPALRPDRVIAKPLAGAASLQAYADPPGAWTEAVPLPARWPIRPGRLADYRTLAWCHYVAGVPAAHHRVWVIDAPEALRTWGAPAIAAVCVVSPPVPNVRGRNAVFGQRYAGPDKRLCLRRLNAEIECISRVVVHPIYRSAGLAVRLVGHALDTARTPVVEALAAMGAVHPLFERAGMTKVDLPPSLHAERLHSALEAVGLSAADVVAVEPIRAKLAQAKSRTRAFLQDELTRFGRRAVGARQLAKLPDPLPAICRKARAQYIYYYRYREDRKGS